MSQSPITCHAYIHQYFSCSLTQIMPESITRFPVSHIASQSNRPKLWSQYCPLVHFQICLCLCLSLQRIAESNIFDLVFYIDLQKLIQHIGIILCILYLSLTFHFKYNIEKERRNLKWLPTNQGMNLTRIRARNVFTTQKRLKSILHILNNQDNLVGLVRLWLY